MKTKFKLWTSVFLCCLCPVIHKKPKPEIIKTILILPPVEHQMSVKLNCELCSDTFVNKVYLEEPIFKNQSSHKNIVSTLLLKPSQNKFTCTHCGYNWNTRKALKMHTTRVHCSNSTTFPKLNKQFMMANPPSNPMATNPMARLMWAANDQFLDRQYAMSNSFNQTKPTHCTIVIIRRRGANRN